MRTVHISFSKIEHLQLGCTRLSYNPQTRNITTSPFRSARSPWIPKRIRRKLAFLNAGEVSRKALTPSQLEAEDPKSAKLTAVSRRRIPRYTWLSPRRTIHPFVAEKRLRALEKCIGYIFNDKLLAFMSLSPSDYKVVGFGELPTLYLEVHDHRRLALLGDRALDLALCQTWYETGRVRRHYATEEARLVTRSSLSRAARKLRLDRVLLGAFIDDDVLAEAFEALIGAIYVDSNYSLQAVLDVLSTIKFRTVQTATPSVRGEEVRSSPDAGALLQTGPGGGEEFKAATSIAKEPLFELQAKQKSDDLLVDTFQPDRKQKQVQHDSMETQVALSIDRTGQAVQLHHTVDQVHFHTENFTKKNFSPFHLGVGTLSILPSTPEYNICMQHIRGYNKTFDSNMVYALSHSSYFPWLSELESRIRLLWDERLDGDARTLRRWNTSHKARLRRMFNSHRLVKSHESATLKLPHKGLLTKVARQHLQTHFTQLTGSESEVWSIPLVKSLCYAGLSDRDAFLAARWLEINAANSARRACGLGNSAEFKRYKRMGMLPWTMDSEIRNGASEAVDAKPADQPTPTTEKQKYKSKTRGSQPLRVNRTVRKPHARPTKKTRSQALSRRTRTPATLPPKRKRNPKPGNKDSGSPGSIRFVRSMTTLIRRIASDTPPPPTPPPPPPPEFADQNNATTSRSWTNHSHTARVSFSRLSTPDPDPDPDAGPDTTTSTSTRRSRRTPRKPRLASVDDLGLVPQRLPSRWSPDMMNRKLRWIFDYALSDKGEGRR